METPSKPGSTRQSPKTLLRLEQKEYFRLYKWLESNIPQLEPGITRTQVAVLASADLGFEMNENHIRSALNTIGLDLPGTANPRALEEKIAVLVRTVHILWRHAYPESEMPTELKELL